MYFRKSIDSCQPAQSAQADNGRNFLVSLFFFSRGWTIYTLIQSIDGQIDFYESIIRDDLAPFRQSFDSNINYFFLLVFQVIIKCI